MKIVFTNDGEPMASLATVSWLRGKNTGVCVIRGKKERQKKGERKDRGKSVMHKYVYGRFGPPVRGRSYMVTLW